MTKSAPDTDDNAPHILRSSAKLSLNAFKNILQRFVHGVPIIECAETTGVSARTVRETYRLLRPRLMRSAFKRWHPLDTIFVDQTKQKQQDSDWQNLITALAACQNNTTCWNNYRDGKRQKRLCRACPVNAACDDADRVAGLIQIGDSARDFYAHLGWGVESQHEDPATLLYERIIHANVINKALNATPELSENIYDFADEGFHSIRTLYAILIADLIIDPL